MDLHAPVLRVAVHGIVGRLRTGKSIAGGREALPGDAVVLHEVIPDSLRLLPGQRSGIPVRDCGLPVRVSFDPDVRVWVRLNNLGDGV